MPITKVTAMMMTMILKMTVMMKMTLKKITKSRERQGNPIIVSPISNQHCLTLRFNHHCGQNLHLLGNILMRPLTIIMVLVVRMISIMGNKKETISMLMFMMLVTLKLPASKH